MQSILQNQTIRSFLKNFERADQSHIIQDLIIIGIQTVLKNVKSNPQTQREDSLEKSFNKQTLAQIQHMKRDISTINKQLSKTNYLPISEPNQVRIVRHEVQNQTGWSRASPRNRQVTGKVTQTYPEARTIAPARSQERFRHHLDDREARQTFVQIEPPRNTYSQIPKPPSSMKPSQDKNQQIENISYTNYESKKQMLQKDKKQQPKNSYIKNSRLSQDNPERNRNKTDKSQKKSQSKANQFDSARKISSKIKDLIDFDKKNSRLLNFHDQQKIKPIKQSQIKNQQVMSFKKDKQVKPPVRKQANTNRVQSPSQSLSSSSCSEQSFSPYKKDKPVRPQLLQQTKSPFNSNQVQSNKRSSFEQSSQQKSDQQSQFSRYETSQLPSHYKHETGSYSSYSGAQSSSSSRLFSNKAIGKITRKK